MKFTFFDPDKEDKPKEQPKPAAAPQVSQPQRRGLVLDWVHELGWSENPFTQFKASPSHEFMVDQERPRQLINLFFIQHSSFGTITAEEGEGKTFMLQWIKEELEHYKDRYSVYLFDSTESIEAFSKELTQQYSKLLSKYKGTTPEELAAYLKQKATKRIVLLVDNIDDNEQLRPYCKALVDSGAAAIVSSEKPAAFMKDELSVKLHSLSAADAEALLEKRIQAVGGSGIEPFRKKLVEELWKVSKQNPVQFLKYCNETAMKIALKQITLPEEEKPAKGAKKGKEPKEIKPEPEQKESKQRSAYDNLIEGLAK